MVHIDEVWEEENYENEKSPKSGDLILKEMKNQDTSL